VTSLRFAEKFFFPFRIKHFCAHIWKLTADSARPSPVAHIGCGPGPRWDIVLMSFLRFCPESRSFGEVPGGVVVEVCRGTECAAAAG